MVRKPILTFLIVLVVLASITVAAKYIIFSDELSKFKEYGSIIKIDKKLPPITIGSTEGRITIPIPGKVNIFTPQYINCPDICHLESRMMVYVMNKSIEYGINDEIVFITINVDPWRDDEEAARDYMYYNARQYLDKIEWIWLVDTPENMEKVWNTYGILVERVPETGEIVHFGGFLIVDRNGVLKYILAPSSSGWSDPKAFAEGLWYVVKAVVEGREIEVD